MAVATQGSPAVYDDVLLGAHMVQHLLLIMVAPPLLILGRPVTLLLRVARVPLRNHLKHILRSRLVSALTWPPAAAALYAAVVIGTHLTPLMNLVLDNTAVHEAEHGLYLAVGYLYFLPAIGTEPIRWRLPVFGRFLLLLVTMPVDTLVGVVLILENAAGKAASARCSSRTADVRDVSGHQCHMPIRTVGQCPDGRCYPPPQRLTHAIKADVTLGCPLQRSLRRAGDQAQAAGYAMPGRAHPGHGDRVARMESRQDAGQVIG